MPPRHFHHGKTPNPGNSRDENNTQAPAPQLTDISVPHSIRRTDENQPYQRRSVILIRKIAISPLGVTSQPIGPRPPEQPEEHSCAIRIKYNLKKTYYLRHSTNHTLGHLFRITSLRNRHTTTEPSSMASSRIMVPRSQPIKRHTQPILPLANT